ncbi:orotate phosphoribosyltransferase [Marinicauda salina]|uniref:Orotate phosphoribosyltransferase n=1 Tax=Marinicauda salina TaxID=2135793 RepID=A0A2U2BUM2_9PROT|nr:orotate phosphoribosyltransferase [Marinicauda salina]PWE17680.1 orotate phosphoribosyltransferase [Marinicauda salina]
MSAQPADASPSTPNPAEARAALKALIRRLSFSEGEAKTLASGKTSSFYFDMKRTMSQPQGLALIADLMLDEIRPLSPDYIGGLEMGAIPILNGVALESHRRGCDIPTFWIRKKAKAHGSQSRLEGLDLADLEGKTAVMVEDVTTTGGSVLQAIEEARGNGVTVDHVVTVVDREEGAADNLEKAGVTLHAVFRASEFKTDG